MSVTSSLRTVLGALLTLLLTSSLLVGLAPTADAATITVTRTDDPAPGAPGECGSPASNSSDDCSLRQAIRRANDVAGADVIVLPADTYVLSEVGAGEDDGATGDLDVLDDLTITGAGSGTTTISGTGMHGGGPDRLLHVDGVDFTLTGATLTGGESGTLGGALRNEGGDVTLTDVVFTGNTTTAEGGGAFATLNGDVTVTDSRFEGNDTSGSYGGAIFQFAFDDGGPVTSTVTITDSVLTGNTSRYGGAIHTEAEGNSTADLVIERSELVENTAQDCCGGAIIADDGEWGSGGPDARTNVVIRDSTIDRNDAVDCCGGAIYAEGTGGTPEPSA